MTIKELNKSKLPIVKVDKKLENQADTVLFPEKLDQANDILRVAGLPGPPRPKRSIGKSKNSRIERS